MRFECQRGWTKCCEQPGFVYLTEDDVLRLAAFLSLAPDVFQAKYVFRTKNMRRLRVPRHANCAFLGPDGCRVHEAKPLQCRTFPYWPELLKGSAPWRRTGSWCPGIGKGDLVNITMARAEAGQMKEAHPHLYE